MSAPQDTIKSWRNVPPAHPAADLFPLAPRRPSAERPLRGRAGGEQ